MRCVARISATLAAASLLLFAAVLCLWPRTTRVMDTVSFLTHSDTEYKAGTCPYALAVSVGHNVRAAHDPHDPQRMDYGWSFSSAAPGAPRSYSYSDASGTTFVHVVVHVSAPSGPKRNRLGFAFHSGTTTMPRSPYASSSGTVVSTWTLAAIPLWFVATILMIWPAVFLTRQIRRRRRTRLGRCLQCGYDLRGSSSRCPECGTPVPDRSIEVGS